MKIPDGCRATEQDFFSRASPRAKNLTVAGRLRVSLPKMASTQALEMTLLTRLSGLHETLLASRFFSVPGL